MADAPRLMKSDWECRLDALLPLFGHRNWIVVADSAYPAHSSAGIETLSSGADLLDVARKVLVAIAGCRHVRANVYCDRELEFIEEADAPGVSEYRTQLAGILTAAHANYLPHEQIMAKLDRSAELFRILIIKTELALPYTSIFFELDCGYWSAEAENRLRVAMAAKDDQHGTMTKG